ncbi:SDR family oxidoreductase [Aeromicrobium sp.]|uniref:SDR family oxidoreductase n=1 Tax=Aeromicrobium sp. TaxID=1871063 RepID=UPI003D6AB056
MTKLSDTTTVITGAGSGIGRATAVLAAERGSRLVLTDVSAESLAETVRHVTAAGGTVAHHEALDVRDVDAVNAFAARTHEVAGPVDLVMNIAGISTWGRIQDLTTEHWRRTVDIDLMGPIHILAAFVPAMIEAGRGGHVVNVSSAAGLFGLPIHAPYSAAKFGLRGVSEVLRFDLAPHGIGMTLVCPGAVATPLVGSVDIVGIDRDDPAVQRAIESFSRHAVTSEKAAGAIIRGVEKDRYLVYTSSDIRLLHLAQRYVPFVYTFVMRLLNRRARAFLKANIRRPVGR